MTNLARARRFHALVLLAGSSLFAGCSGSVGQSEASPQDDGPAGGGKGRPVDPSVNDPTVNALFCEKKGLAPVEPPLRRLTRQQYVNTLRDLLDGVATVPNDLELPPETIVAGFDNNAGGQTSTLALLQGYHGAASAVAKEAAGAAAKLSKLAPCAQGASEDTCGETFVKSFGKRAFRRPLQADEVTRLMTVFKAIRPDHGYAQAIEGTLTAMLMAPQFVFRPESGSSDRKAAGARPLSSYEVASRLSYLLWDTMPDAILMAAADADELKDVDGIRAQAERLLDDPRARESVARFHSQWLGLSKLEKLEKDKDAFPDFGDDTRASMRTSIERYIEYTFWEKGSLSALLTDSSAFIDAKLAPIYEVDAGGDMDLTSLDRDRRAGILTQAGFMAALAKPAHDSPVHRGLFVLDHFLCADMADAPMDVAELEAPKPGEPPRTTRERVEMTHSDPVCANCHQYIDGIGFAFGHYDAIGKYRDQENGIDIDASGELLGTRDINGRFKGAVELGQKLASSSQVQQCVATQWFRYGFGKLEDDTDHCALKPIVDAFVNSDGDMKGLLMALVTSDAFRFRNDF